jgi:hypothetical protein
MSDAGEMAAFERRIVERLKCEGLGLGIDLLEKRAGLDEVRLKGGIGHGVTLPSAGLGLENRARTRFLRRRRLQVEHSRAERRPSCKPSSRA